MGSNEAIEWYFLTGLTDIFRASRFTGWQQKIPIYCLYNMIHASVSRHTCLNQTAIHGLDNFVQHKCFNSVWFHNSSSPGIFFRPVHHGVLGALYNPIYLNKEGYNYRYNYIELNPKIAGVLGNASFPSFCQENCSCLSFLIKFSILFQLSKWK